MKRRHLTEKEIVEVFIEMEASASPHEREVRPNHTKVKY